MIEYVNGFLPYGDEKAQTYINTQTGNHTFSNRLEEWGVIALGSINSNQTKIIDLQSLNVKTPISLKSLYVFANHTTDDEIKQFNILRRLTNNSIVKLGTMRLDDKELPYRFPDGAILLPDNLISLQPKRDIDNIYIYFKPIAIVSYLDAS